MLAPQETKYKMLAVVGPTACGKTSLAVDLALALGGEVISADSRQVYRGMDIGTGKDIAEGATPLYLLSASSHHLSHPNLLILYW